MTTSQKRVRLAISRPTEGAAGRTGTWRVFKPVVDKEKCNACGLCATYCPDAVITDDLGIDLRWCGKRSKRSFCKNGLP